MDDLISRRAAIDEIEWGITCAKVINIETGEIRELFGKSNDELRKAVDRVKALPTIDPVKRGKWIKLGAAKYRCGECGKVQYGDRDSDLHFCCNCGTKNMDGWEYV